MYDSDRTSDDEQPGDRYDRQERLFGRLGQNRLARTRIGLVGLGGIGSHLAQQLAYLGVCAYVLIDPDRVTGSSLNRVVGAVQADAVDAALKVEVAERTIKAIQPQAIVHSYAAPLASEEARNALADRDVIIGGLDDDTARIELIKTCSAAATPFFDAATDVDTESEPIVWGGRVAFSGTGERCPSCLDLLDQKAMQLAVMSPEQRAADKALYGVSGEALAGAGPAVVSINGVIASLVVTEFMAWRTRLRAPWPLLTYRGGVVLRNLDEPRSGCPYCTRWPSTGERAA
jgi:molybdopterin-synthase adenylyltransferase